jgi:lipopolysaccharide transport system ATP-binding protein
MAQIIVSGLGKAYKLYPSRWARLEEWLSLGRRTKHQPFWALRGVSFTVEPGEAVGIIGQNGAGKSTLLKILTGTTRPSEGSYDMGGRVAALLELGMGFHPDFTGTQNAIMGCLMLGLSTTEIHERLPEIAVFAELADYMDQPLRGYSTGMQMRLAFSVATAVRPDILIVDEALSVGDAYFQHKSMRRIRSFRDEGTTLLFASHDPGAVKSLCDRAVLLDHGLLTRAGSSDTVLDYYNALIATKENEVEIRQFETEHGRIATRSGSGLARIVSVALTDPEGRPCRAFQTGDIAKLGCAVQFDTRRERPTVGFLIRDRLGNEVFGTNTHHLNVFEPVVEACETLIVTFTIGLNIGYGNYSISVAVHTRNTHLEQNFDWWDQALVFQVIPNNSYRFVGTSMLPVEAQLKRQPSERQAPTRETNGVHP